MQRLPNRKTAVLISAALSCIPLSNAAAQTLESLAGYWVDIGDFRGGTLTRFFEVTTSGGTLTIHSTALKFELPNRPVELSDPYPDETYTLMVQDSELTGRHEIASYRFRDCTVAPSSEPVSGHIWENGQISLRVNTGHMTRDADPAACHVDYSDPAVITVWLKRHMDQ